MIFNNKFLLIILLFFLQTACFQETNYSKAFQNGDYERSFYLLKQAERNSPDPFVHNLLGAHYELGLATPRNYSKAYKYYERAAIADLPQAQVNLGRMIENGRGTVLDPALAYGWYWAAFHSGHDSALPYVQNLSGQLYAHLINEARKKVSKILNKDLTVVK